MYVIRDMKPEADLNTINANEHYKQANCYYSLCCKTFDFVGNLISKIRNTLTRMTIKPTSIPIVIFSLSIRTPQIIPKTGIKKVTLSVFVGPTFSIR